MKTSKKILIFSLTLIMLMSSLTFVSYGLGWCGNCGEMGWYAPLHKCFECGFNSGHLYGGVSYYVKTISYPTCTSSGSKQYKEICSGTQCKYVNYFTVSTSALGHSYGSGSYYSTVSSATCNSGGTAKYVKYCTRCGAASYYNVSTSALGHSYGGSSFYSTVTAATCTSGGSDRYVSYCTRCGAASYSTSGTSALGHSYGGSSFYSTVTAATCTSGGSDRYVSYCTRCGAASYSTSGTSALGHSYGGSSYYSTVTAATCTSGGTNKYVSYCTRCGAASYTTSSTSALGHSYGSSSYSSTVTAATCTTGGSDRYVSYCTRCGATSYSTKSTSALGHNHTGASTFNSTVTAPTCTTTGTDKYVNKCTRCGGDLQYSNKTVLALGHSAGSFIKVDSLSAPATYDTKGYNYYAQSCTRCSVQLATKTIDFFKPRALPVITQNNYSVTDQIDSTNLSDNSYINQALGVARKDTITGYNWTLAYPNGITQTQTSYRPTFLLDQKNQTIGEYKLSLIVEATLGTTGVKVKSDNSDNYIGFTAKTLLEVKEFTDRVTAKNNWILNEADNTKYNWYVEKEKIITKLIVDKVISEENGKIAVKVKLLEQPYNDNNNIKLSVDPAATKAIYGGSVVTPVITTFNSGTNIMTIEIGNDYLSHSNKKLELFFAYSFSKIDASRKFGLGGASFKNIIQEIGVNGNSIDFWGNLENKINIKEVNVQYR